jgi:hypothetical protein
LAKSLDGVEPAVADGLGVCLEAVQRSIRGQAR